MSQRNPLPHYQGCLNLLHALYVLWWRDAQRHPHLLYQLAAWTDQPIDQLRSRPPRSFYSHHSPQEQHP